MNLLILNGSPRRKTSNSTLLTEQFLNGFRSTNHETSIRSGYLADETKMTENLELFIQASHVIIIFPLYTDCMPGVVKEFFEKLPLNISQIEKKIGFIVQSGFPEPVHSVFVERYLGKLVKRLGYTYIGTVIKGGVEGIKVMPPSMTRKLYQGFKKLGEHYALHGEFDPRVVREFRTPLRFSKVKLLIMKMIMPTGLMNFYWNSELKKNGAYNQRFDQPLASALRQAQ
jgi:NAD(P)H-dependent FMN reductase